MADEQYENDALPEGATVPEDNPYPELGDLPYAYKKALVEKRERAAQSSESHAQARGDDSRGTGEPENDAAYNEDDF